MYNSRYLLVNQGVAVDNRKAIGSKLLPLLLHSITGWNSLCCIIFQFHQDTPLVEYFCGWFGSAPCNRTWNFVSQKLMHGFLDHSISDRTWQCIRSTSMICSCGGRRGVSGGASRRQQFATAPGPAKAAAAATSTIAATHTANAAAASLCCSSADSATVGSAATSQRCSICSNKIQIFLHTIQKLHSILQSHKLSTG